jgi:hypothetical protein
LALKNRSLVKDTSFTVSARPAQLSASLERFPTRSDSNVAEWRDTKTFGRTLRITLKKVF